MQYDASVDLNMVNLSIDGALTLSGYFRALPNQDIAWRPELAA